MKTYKLISLLAGLLATAALAQAQQYTPAALSNVIFTGTIVSATGGASTTGVINSLLANNSVDYTLQSNGSLTNPAPFSYSKSTGTTATLTESAVGALPGVRVTLTFTSETTGNFAATYDGGSTQMGSFTLVPVGGVSPLVNVSCLTTIPAGGTAITGFVIVGTGPHKVLIRAVGPTLAQYGVTSPLPNPTITVWTGTTVLAQDDDWDTGANVDSTLSATFAQVGAFGLPAGSKDAALVITLNPGVYSAQISSVNSTDTGKALMEVYLIQ